MSMQSFPKSPFEYIPKPVSSPSTSRLGEVGKELREKLAKRDGRVKHHIKDEESIELISWEGDKRKELREMSDRLLVRAEEMAQQISGIKEVELYQDLMAADQESHRSSDERYEHLFELLETRSTRSIDPDFGYVLQTVSTMTNERMPRWVYERLVSDEKLQEIMAHAEIRARIAYWRVCRGERIEAAELNQIAEDDRRKGGLFRFAYIPWCIRICRRQGMDAKPWIEKLRQLNRSFDSNEVSVRFSELMREFGESEIALTSAKEIKNNPELRRATLCAFAKDVSMPLALRQQVMREVREDIEKNIEDVLVQCIVMGEIASTEAVVGIRHPIDEVYWEHKIEDLNATSRSCGMRVNACLALAAIQQAQGIRPDYFMDQAVKGIDIDGDDPQPVDLRNNITRGLSLGLDVRPLLERGEALLLNGRMNASKGSAIILEHSYCDALCTLAPEEFEAHLATFPKKLAGNARIMDGYARLAKDAIVAARNLYKLSRAPS